MSFSLLDNAASQYNVDMEPEVISRKDALAAGLKRYFTGEPCKFGHIAQRLVSTCACCECATAYKAAYRETNREAIIAYRVAYHETNREAIAGRKAAHYKSNKYAVIARVKARYKDNREARVAYQVAYKKANKDAVVAYRTANKERLRASAAAWSKANPEKVRANVRNRRARQRAAEGSHTAAEIQALLERQRCKCAYCDASLKKGYHADHITPLAKGGSNYISNIQLTCPKCNLRKHAKDPLTFAQQMGKLL